MYARPKGRDASSKIVDSSVQVQFDRVVVEVIDQLVQLVSVAAHERATSAGDRAAAWAQTSARPTAICPAPRISPTLVA
jgi:hypothetical protein